MIANFFDQVSPVETNDMTVCRLRIRLEGRRPILPVNGMRRVGIELDVDDCGLIVQLA